MKFESKFEILKSYLCESLYDLIGHFTYYISFLVVSKQLLFVLNYIYMGPSMSLLVI